MIHEAIQLESSDATLVTYVHDKSAQWDFQIDARPAVIVLPGGAYSFLSDSESEPVALTFMARGYNTFVLNYTVGEKCAMPLILEELSRAILTICRLAEEWHTNPHAIVPMGFSAGACLAGISATQWNTPGLAERVGAERVEDIRPDACVIGYGCWDNSRTIQGDPAFYNPHAAKIAKDCTPELDMINYAGPQMPPLFIWHNRDDQFVPVTNPLMIASRMTELGLPYELHVFGGGRHGMSVANDLACHEGHMRAVCEESPSVAEWVPLAMAWIDRLFGVKRLDRVL